MPIEIQPGQPMLWRRQAAELAIAVAYEVQGLKSEGLHFSDNEDQIAYEAALYAAPDMPDAVSLLCLELAQRRVASPQIRERADRARAEAEEEQRCLQRENPERTRQIERLCTPVSPLSPLRAAWPDGPRTRVDEAFQTACLDTAAFPSFARVRPNDALEVLLAVCIESPQHEDPFGSHHSEDCGLDHWHGGHPPLYFRVSFL